MRQNEIAVRWALEYARGNFQRGIVTGQQRLSLSDLKGNAKLYSGKYARSRDSILALIRTDRRLDVSENTGKHGLRVLVIGLSRVGVIEAVKARLLTPEQEVA